MSGAPGPIARRPAGWAAAGALVLLAWAAGLPVAYLLLLLHPRMPHVVLPLLLVGWTAVSVLLTIRVRRAARLGAGAPRDDRRARFASLPQRAALLMNAGLLGIGVVGAAFALLGGTRFSIASGPEPGLVALIVGGFLLAAAALPAAVLNGLWSLDRRTAEEEAAVLRRDAIGARGAVRVARAVAASTWIAYGGMALGLLVAAVLGVV